MVPDVVGLTSAVASTVDMKAEPYSEAHAAFLAESEALQAPEKNGATALVYWGLEIGIQPDQRSSSRHVLGHCDLRPCRNFYLAVTSWQQLRAHLATE